MQLIVAGVFWIAFLALPDWAMAKPDPVPVFDVEQSCREARAFAGDDKTLAYQGCMKDEKDARAELVRKWVNFHSEDRRDCVAQGAAPMPSYVEILTCLEMSDQARALYNPDGSARAKPGSASQGLSAPSVAAPTGNSPGPAAPAGTEGVPKPADSPLVPKPAE